MSRRSVAGGVWRCVARVNEGWQQKAGKWRANCSLSSGQDASRGVPRCSSRKESLCSQSWRGGFEETWTPPSAEGMNRVKIVHPNRGEFSLREGLSDDFHSAHPVGSIEPPPTAVPHPCVSMWARKWFVRIYEKYPFLSFLFDFDEFFFSFQLQQSFPLLLWFLRQIEESVNNNII